MGQYLATGIVLDIRIERKEIINNQLSIDLVTKKLKESINLNMYHYSEDADYHYWKINPRLLDKNISEFLETQFTMYSSEQDQAMIDVLHKVKSAQNGEELIDLATNDGSEHFQLVKYITEHIRVKNNTNFTKHVSAHYQLIAYFLDGKMMMECYNNIFSYFEKNIHLQKSKYPVAEYVKIMISG